MWSGAVARRLGERSLLSDFGSRVYTLLIGMCVVRAASSAYIILTIRPSSEIRASFAVLQFAIFGAVYAALAGLQAARYAVRIDGAALFADTPLFPQFRRLLGRRFLFERPFAVGGAILLVTLGWVALIVEPRPAMALAVLATFAVTPAFAFSIYRFAPPAGIRKSGFSGELTMTAIAVIANPDIRRGGKIMVSTVFNAAIPSAVMESRLLFVLLIHVAVALVLFAFFMISATPEHLASAWAKRHGTPPVPVWAMPLKRVRGGYWTLAWATTYLLYAFCGRRPAAMIISATAFAIVGGLGQVVAFLAGAQELGDDADEHFPARYWVLSTILVALPHLVPCAILPFVE